MALLGKIAPGDIAIGINALQEAILACQEFEMSKSVTIDSYKYAYFLDLRSFTLFQPK